jgi:hypothetical protein
MPTSGSALSFHPFTLDRWGDFVELFGEQGRTVAADGCLAIDRK